MNKNILSLSIIILLLFFTMLPLEAASSSSKDLDYYISKTKKLIDIPEHLSSFNFLIKKDINGNETLTLEWHNPSPDSFEGIVVSYNANNQITYYEYIEASYLDSHTQTVIPKISQTDAIEISKKFIRKVGKDISEKVTNFENNSITFYPGKYSVFLQRIHNNIPVEGEGVYLDIDTDNGNVISYSRNVSNLNPQKDSPYISPQFVKAIYLNELGYDIFYGIEQKNEKSRVFPVYGSVYSSVYSIDANSGELIKNPSARLNASFTNYSPPKWENSESDQNISINSFNKKQLTNSLESQAEMINLSDAEKKVRDTKGIRIDSSYTLDNASLKKSIEKTPQYYWQFRFSKKTLGMTDTPQVIFNASTGDIHSFRRYFNYSDTTSQINFSYNQGKQIASEFLQENFSSKYSKCSFFEIAQPDISSTSSQNYSYPVASYVYTRTENGIPFYSNYIQVEVDLTSGQVLSMDQIWSLGVKFRNDFISRKIIDSQIFDSISPNLSYVKYTSDQSPDPNYKLVYSFDTSEAIFNALSGKKLETYSQGKFSGYIDVKNHYARRKIRELYNIGIGFNDKKLHPDDPILQKDFVLLLSQTTGDHLINSSNNNEKVKLDVLYTNLINRNIIHKNEVKPYSYVTREDAVKFLIRALNLEKIASIRRIYNYPFKDKNKANRKLIGHITLANGLNIVNGMDNQNFNPKGNVTKSQALVMIYNYLWHQNDN